MLQEQLFALFCISGSLLFTPMYIVPNFKKYGKPSEWGKQISKDTLKISSEIKCIKMLFMVCIQWHTYIDKLIGSMSESLINI